MTTRQRRLGSPSVVILSVLACLGGGVAGAQTPGEYPPSRGSLITSTNTPPPGGSVDVSGGGFEPSSPVAVALADTVLRAGAADGSGTFRSRVTVPCETAPGPTSLNLRGTGADGQPRTVTAEVTVADATCRSGLGLPRTGSTSSAPLTAAGVVLILTGFCAVVAAWRRRSSEEAWR